MEAIAKTKHLKGSPRKARLVIDLIRGVNVSRALSILKFTDKRAADPIAQYSEFGDRQRDLSRPSSRISRSIRTICGSRPVSSIWARTKNRRRMRPAPQGRAYREQRHYCHITIQVTSEEKPKTEKELRVEAAKAKSGSRPKKARRLQKKAKAPAKKAKAEEVEKATSDALKQLPKRRLRNRRRAAVAEAVETTRLKPKLQMRRSRNVRRQRLRTKRSLRMRRRSDTNDGTEETMLKSRSMRSWRRRTRISKAQSEI